MEKVTFFLSVKADRVVKQKTSPEGNFKTSVLSVSHNEGQESAFSMF